MDIAARSGSLPARLAILAGLASSQAACVTDANKCLPGYSYDPAYDACLQNAAPSDGGTSSREGGEGGGSASEGGGDAAASGDSGLGNACNADGDCAGAASFCLKDPTAAPTDPGICSIPGCTASACGSAYSCCDCTAALVSALTAWPKNVCAPASNKSTLVQFGCTCQ
jgi:hypothetical protein